MPKKSLTAPSRRHWNTISERTSDEPLENTLMGTPQWLRPGAQPILAERQRYNQK
jgi:hypothetical protein